MDTTLEQAKTVAQAFANANGTRFGDFGTVTDESFTKDDESGNSLFHVVQFTKGQMLIAVDTDLPPLMYMSHATDTTWLDSDASLFAKRTADKAHSLMSVGKYKGRLRASGMDTGVSDLARKSNYVWSFSLGRPLLGDAPSSSDVPFPYSGISDTKILNGWEHVALGSTSYERDFTKWNQTGAPYKSKIPGSYIVGCVAVATSQLQCFFGWPNSVPALTHPFQSGFAAAATSYATLNWWRTNPSHAASPTTTPAYMPSDDLLGFLAYNTGVYCSLQYGTSLTGGYTGAAMRGLRMYMGYPHAKFIMAHTETYARSATEGGRWNSSTHSYPALPSSTFKRLIYDNIENGCPVLMSIGVSTSGRDWAGHFVLATGTGLVNSTIPDYEDTPVTFVDVGWGGPSGAPDPTGANNGGDGWYPLPYIYTKPSPTSSVYAYDAIDSVIVQATPGSNGHSRSVPVVGTVTNTVGRTGPTTVTMFNAGGSVLGKSSADATGAFSMLVDPTMMDDGTELEAATAVQRDGFVEIYVKRIGVEVGTTVKSLSGAYPSDCVFPSVNSSVATNGGIPIEHDTYLADLPHPRGTSGASFSGSFTIDTTVPDEIRRVITQTDSSAGT